MSAEAASAALFQLGNFVGLLIAMRFEGFRAGDGLAALGVNLMEVLQQGAGIQAAGAQFLLD